jgi:hypothetical protein
MDGGPARRTSRAGPPSSCSAPGDPARRSGPTRAPARAGRPSSTRPRPPVRGLGRDGRMAGGEGGQALSGGGRAALVQLHQRASHLQLGHQLAGRHVAHQASNLGAARVQHRQRGRPEQRAALVPPAAGLRRPADGSVVTPCVPIRSPGRGEKTPWSCLRRTNWAGPTRGPVRCVSRRWRARRLRCRRGRGRRGRGCRRPARSRRAGRWRRRWCARPGARRSGCRRACRR